MIALAADAGWLWRAPFGSSTLACKCSLRRCARSLWKQNPRISRRSSRDRVGTVGASCRPLLHSSWPPRRAPRTPRRAVDEQCVCVMSAVSLCVRRTGESGGSGGGRRRGGRRGVAAEPSGGWHEVGTRRRGVDRGVFGRVYRGERGVVHRELHTCAT